MELSKDQILQTLKAKGIDVRHLVSDPVLFDKSCSLIYRSLPIPWRWFVGQKRIRTLLNSVRDRFNGNSTNLVTKEKSPEAAVKQLEVHAERDSIIVKTQFLDHRSVAMKDQTSSAHTNAYILCESCGVEVQGPANFCDMCGAELRRSAPSEEGDSDADETMESEDPILKAWRLLDDDKISDALQLAAEVVKNRPNDSEAWALSAQAKFRWGDIEDAVNEYKKALQLKPNESTYYFNLGLVYDSKEDWNDALQQYERAAKIDPHTTKYRASIGGILVRMKAYREAIPILEHCVVEDSDDPLTKAFLAAAYHDSIIESWWRNPHDGKHYCISKAQADEARMMIDKVKSLGADDAGVVAEIGETEKVLQDLYSRKYKGSWVPVIVLGIFYIVPGMLWWLANRRYQYKINKDVHDIVVLGKADSLEGGEVGVYFSLLPPGFKWVAYRLPRFVVWGAIIVLSPITFFYSLYDNYIAE